MVFEKTGNSFYLSNSSVYGWLLDLSKPFVQARHDKLLTKMLNRELPSTLENFLDFSLQKSVCVSYYNSPSNSMTFCEEFR